MENYHVHHTAEIGNNVTIGDGTQIWNHCQIRDGAIIGSNCILSKDVYIDTNVMIGDKVKIQNGVSIYHGITIESGVFLGPHCVFTNDLLPRAVNTDMSVKDTNDWKVTQTLVREGASIGANATIVCGVTIGRWAMVGAGSVVTNDVPNFGLVYGTPARLRGFVCACGNTLQEKTPRNDGVVMVCKRCDVDVFIPEHTYSVYHANK